MQPKPVISKKTRELAEKKRAHKGEAHLSIVDRLFTKNSRHSSLEKASDVIMTSQGADACSMRRAFSPEISARAMEIKRNKKVEQLLYEDALKRREAQKSIALEQEQKAGPKRSISSIFNSQINNKTSLRAFQSRLIKEFNDAFIKIVPETENQLVISFEEFQSIMAAMYFAAPLGRAETSSSKVSTSQELVLRLWCQLNGHVQQFILTRNLLIYLFALMNVYVDSQMIPALPELIKLENLLEKRAESDTSQQPRLSQDKISHQLMPDERQPEIETLNDYFNQQDQQGSSMKAAQKPAEEVKRARF